MEETATRSSGLNADLPSLVFMGTPDFAVPALQKLAAVQAPIRMVVTQPDRPKGRGKKLAASPVKILAQKLGLAVYQPERIRSADGLAAMQACAAEAGVVVAYGQLLSQPLLDLYPLGVLNIHASLLPAYRGAAPIQRAVLAGDAQTGVSIMLLDAGIDTGPVLARRAIPIQKNDTSGTLHEKLAQAGADLLCETLAAWKAGSIRPQAQDEALVTYAPPIAKEETQIDWLFPAERIVNTIRAFDPWPGAYAFYNGKRLKCFTASLLDWEIDGDPGEVVGHTDEGLTVVAGDGRVLCVGELQLEGQRRLPATEFVRGRAMPFGCCLE